MKFECTIPKLLRKIAAKYPEIPAQMSHSKTGQYTSSNYHDFYQSALDFGGALLELGVKRGDKIGLIADNRAEWEHADVGLLAIGAIDVPRGCDATEKDLTLILSFAECAMVITENTSQIKKLLNIKAELPLLKTMIAFDDIDPEQKTRAADIGVKVLQFQDLKKSGHEWRKRNIDAVENELEKGQWDDIATIIFTSGTTGTPKGVMLSHGNFITQLDEVNERIFLNPGERGLCVLPVWHAFQREVEYVIMSQAATICYSKPIGSVLLADLQKLNPTLLPAVPRVFEAVYEGIWRKMRKVGGLTYAIFRFFVKIAEIWSAMDRTMFRKQARFGADHVVFWWFVYLIPWALLWPLKLLGQLLVFRKIQNMLGTNFRAGISGGGAYPFEIDNFFWSVGVPIVEGYGLTETAPIVAVRPVACPVMRTVGTPIRGVQARVVDADGLILPPGQKGSLQVKGGTVMKGYYKRPDLTEKVMTADGWFDTGDLAVLTVDGEIQLRGRKKDTIVLMGGENIEPLPLEEQMNMSRYIAKSVVFGTNEKGVDQRYLVALILPSQEDIESWAKENKIEFSKYEELVTTPEVLKLLEGEIANAVSAKNGFKSFEKINKFAVITKPFEVGVELSAKQEMMRYRIAEIYKDKIAKLYSAK